MCYGCYELAGDLVASERTAGAHPPLPDLWKDYQDWHNDINGPDDEYRPEHSVQSWGNVEEYLGDRHGISPHDPNGLDHPVALGMAKLHSLAQARPQVDGFNGTDDYMLNDNDLTTGAALGLLRIRKNQLTKKLEPVLPQYKASHTTQTAERTADMQFPYLRNNGGMRHAPGFDQEAEPWGRYMSPDIDEHHLPLQKDWERGSVGFSNPLYVPHNYGAWKQELSDAHGGLTGHDLSNALLAKGHDGVITHDQYGLGEIVDIRPKDQRGHHVG